MSKRINPYHSAVNGVLICEALLQIAHRSPFIDRKYSLTNDDIDLPGMNIVPRLRCKGNFDLIFRHHSSRVINTLKYPLFIPEGCT